MGIVEAVRLGFMGGLDGVLRHRSRPHSEELEQGDMSKITDKQRLDFLQSLAKRKAPSTGFNGLVRMIPIDSELHIGDGKSYLMLRDKFGHGDSAAFDRSGKTIRQAIDKAIKHHSKADSNG